MKNLENYGVQKMNAQEINQTDGGSFFTGGNNGGTLWGILAVDRFILGLFAGLGDGLKEGLGL